MSIAAISSSSTASTSSAVFDGLAPSSLTPNDFLKMLIAELQNQ